MNLIEALEILKRPVPKDAPELTVFLACGLTPLHLQNLLMAQLLIRHPERRVEVKTGIFGDLTGNIERLESNGIHALTVVVEWSDLDPRLGLRSLGGWQAERLPDIVNSVDRSLERLLRALQGISSRLPTSICLPTLPLPPLFYTSVEQSSFFELELRGKVSRFAEAISADRRISVVSGQHLDEISPPDKRFDLRTEIRHGFPYKIPHAAAIAELLVKLAFRPEPKKGLITDLDDTLWAGILGEVGVEGIHWHLEERAQLHGIYQQFLASLASAGVLIAAASKNDAAIVDRAFEREDLLLSRTSVFPIEAHWKPKSESVQRILHKWNVLAESVVFIDDSPMEVAEVQGAFPAMECIVFPKNDYATFWKLLSDLRAHFAKVAISEEDSLRLQSIRNSEAFRRPEGEDHDHLDHFLQHADGRLSFDSGKIGGNARAFEMINKTNQFNLNGRRYDETAWARLLEDSQTHLITVSYTDKFGNLGRIAVLIGKLTKKRFVLDSWVMSCRAFSRRIEYHCIQYLFENLDAAEIAFEFQATSRNGPLSEFLQQLVNEPVEANLLLSRSAFQRKTLNMPHRVEEVSTLG